MSTPSPEIDALVAAEVWSAAPEAESWARAAIAAAARLGPPIRPGAEVSLLLTDDAGVADLNVRWRGKAGPTNVLSFPLTTPDRLASAPMLGDVAIAYETVAREAQALGKPFRRHFEHLAIHGYLHLVGFDHETESGAEAMEALEREAMAAIGAPDPYACSGPAAPVATE